jgi:hypothetical protein
MGALDRWVMPSFTSHNGISINNVSSFTITILNPSGTWSGTETTGVSIYAKVEGVTFVYGVGGSNKKNSSSDILKAWKE